MKVLVLLATLLLLVSSTVQAEVSYLNITVGPAESEFTVSYVDSAVIIESLDLTGINYQDRVMIAFDHSGVRYQKDGPDQNGKRDAYIFSGNHTLPDQTFVVRFANFGTTKAVALYDPARTVLWESTLSDGERVYRTLPYRPATLGQWRTQGYKLQVQTVPEPSSMFALFTFAGLGGFVLRRRK